MALNLSAASLSQIASSSSSPSSSACGHHFVFLKPKHNPLKLRQFSSSKAFVQAESTESGFSDPQLSSSLSSSPEESVSSSRSQLDLLEQLTSGTGKLSDPGYDSDGSSNLLTIRDQLARLGDDRDDDFSIQLGKNLKKVSPKFLTTSQKRNIKRQAYLNEVSKRNDSVFFATIGAFVILPPVIILGIAIALGYVQLFP
ncbi:hypothetical protein LINPERHAP1_LOCUS6991 [Linum perenne]